MMRDNIKSFILFFFFCYSLPHSGYKFYKTNFTKQLAFVEIKLVCRKRTQYPINRAGGRNFGRSPANEVLTPAKVHFIF